VLRLLPVRPESEQGCILVPHQFLRLVLYSLLTPLVLIGQVGVRHLLSYCLLLLLGT
jgi:hypothetical protein